MTRQAAHHYVLALGSNRAGRAGRTPQAMLRAALAALRQSELAVTIVAPFITTAALGPSRRRFANSAVIIVTPMAPRALLALTQQIERDLGRRQGQRWGARPIDIDIIFWSGGGWQDRALMIPHPAWWQRDFVLRPLLAIAPRWRDPISGLTARHRLARLRSSRPIPSAAPRLPAVNDKSSIFALCHGSKLQS